MARINLDLPTELPVVTEITVRVTDLNYGNHLGNDAMLSLIHEARFRFLRSLGHSERDVEGKSLVLADAAIIYRNESFAGDRLRFRVGIGDRARVSCDLCYRVERVDDCKLIAEAKTGLVFLDPHSRRPTSLPRALQ
jgi:acyl-CoA thioester hydrolase